MKLALFVICFFLLFGASLQDTTPLLAGSSGSGAQWTTPSNALVVDNNLATGTSKGSTLTVSGFSIPSAVTSGSNLVSISVTVTRSGDNPCDDSTISLNVGSSTVSFTLSPLTPITSSLTTATYTASSLSITSADFLNAVTLQYTYNGGGGCTTVQVDGLQFSITYTPWVTTQQQTTLQTTQEQTTALQTTSVTTREQTTALQTTSVTTAQQTTQVQVTTLEQTTAQQTTSVTTQQQTTALQTTREQTTREQTTREQTTREQTTSVTTRQQTTREQTTRQQTTSVTTREQTTSVTTRQQTTALQTTSVTTGLQTTSVTTQIQTTSQTTSVTTAVQTTSQQTTSITTALRTTSVTTGLQTTSVTTALRTTSVTTAEQTTSVTTDQQTTDQQTTALQTTFQQSTAQQTTGQQTTSRRTTAQQTTNDGAVAPVTGDSKSVKSGNGSAVAIGVAIPLILIVLIVVIVVVVIVLRKRKQNPKDGKEETVHLEEKKPSVPPSTAPSNANLGLSPVVLPPFDENQVEISVAVTKLPGYIDKLKKPIDSTKPQLTGYVMEYFFIEDNSQYQADYSCAIDEVNREKNRYENVLPPEHSRVVLSGAHGQNFINANFIPGLIPGTEQQYIATQGPLANTVLDFWRMVWEKNVSVILMLTKEIEKNTLKCNQYWPDDGQVFDMQVLHLAYNERVRPSVTATDELVTRHFRLTLPSTGETREVIQYQYIAWPDHGLPASDIGFLNLIESSDRSNHTKGPLVVHCSAGLGRTGTFILVHSVLQKALFDYNMNMNKEPQINLAKPLLNMRKYRLGLIQTEEQYLFCWLAVRDGIQPIIEDFEARKRASAPVQDDSQKGHYQSLSAIHQELNKGQKGGHYQSFTPAQQQPARK